MIAKNSVGGNQTINVNVVIDEALYLQKAREAGYVSPDAAEALREQLQGAQNDLNSLRQQSPDWREQVDEVIASFNASDPEEARAAFARLDELISSHREHLAEQEARSKHAQATLLYPFEASKAAPLMAAAAELATDNFWYWIESARLEHQVGKLAEAERACCRALELTSSEGDSRRDYSVALEDLGDVKRDQGDLTGALDAYSESLEIARALAERDLGNAGWQRDVSVSLEKVGDVRRDQGDPTGALDTYSESLEIRRALAERDPSNAVWQRDFSVSLERMGDVRRDQGDLTGALDAFSEGLEIRRTLAARDPSNAVWQRDLSVSLNKVGDVRRDQDDLTGALDVYSEDLEIARALAERDRGNAGWQRDVWVSLWRMAEVDEDNAVAHWEEAVARLEDMNARGILAPVDVPFIELARQNLEAARRR